MKAERKIEEEEIEEKRRIRKEKKEKQEKQDGESFDLKKFTYWMKDTHVNKEIFKKYFKLESPNIMYEVWCKANDKETNSKLVNIFNSGLKDLKEEIKKMSEAEIKIEDSESIVEIVEKILNFNKQN